MKSEERHQLHENDLAGVLERWQRKVEPYTNQAVVAVLVAAVVLLGGLLWRRSVNSAAAKGWGQLAAANSADGFLTVADDHPNTDVAAWAQLRAAELYLAEGLQSVTSHRATAEERLGNAEKTFQRLLQNEKIPPRVRERALYGLAVARESMSGAETHSAVAAYKELLRLFPDSQHAGLASQRISDLESESTREFYAWLDKQPRVPEDRPKPRDLTSVVPSGLGLDPFMLLDRTESDQPRFGDRPPSPEAPVPAGETAPPFPEPPGAADAPASPPASATPPEGAASPPTTPGGGTTAPPPEM